MSIAYGFNCICGAEWDLSIQTAQSVKYFKCPFCGRQISTGFDPPKNVYKKSEEDGKTKRIKEGKIIDDNELKRQRKNLTFSYSWLASLEPGERRDCNLMLGYYEFEPQAYKVTYSAEPFEGRHMREVRSESFTNYKAALELAIELAKYYAPYKVINEIKRKLKEVKKNV